MIKFFSQSKEKNYGIDSEFNYSKLPIIGYQAFFFSLIVDIGKFYWHWTILINGYYTG